MNSHKITDLWSILNIMYFIGNHVLEERVEGVHIKDRDSIRRRKYAR
ncbi:hypothetical protein EMIT0180MI3_12393 [Priestia megaterium]